MATVEILNKYYEKAREYPKIWIVLGVILVIWLLFWFPHWEVAKYGIKNPKDLADAENSSRATLAQILGGVAVAGSLYYTWRRVTVAEKELKITQKSQITERFTRAVDQLGAGEHGAYKKLEIRLGGIYALEGIANESDEYYSQIIEILTAYVRFNSTFRELEYKNVDFEELSNRAYLDLYTRLTDSPEIQAIITVIIRRQKFLGAGEFNGLEFQKTYLQAANFTGTTTNRMYTYRSDNREVHLEGAFFYRADLIGADFTSARLEGANFDHSYVTRAYFINCHLERAKLTNAHIERVSFENAKCKGAYFDGSELKGAIFVGANLKGARFHLATLTYAMFDKANLEDAMFPGAHLENANFEGADLKGADFLQANLKGAKLSVSQLSKVKTLYEAELDDELLIPLKRNYPALFE